MKKEYRQEFRLDYETKHTLTFLAKECNLSVSEFLCRLINVYGSDYMGLRSLDVLHNSNFCWSDEEKEQA